MRVKHEQDIIEINNLRDTITIPQCVSDNNQGTDKSGSGLSSKAKNQSGIRCYTESELLRKIESSLGIARQCDELAVKYNALLKVCKE